MRVLTFVVAAELAIAVPAAQPRDKTLNIYVRTMLPVAALTPRAGSSAPPPPVHNGPAHWIKVAAAPDGSFTVTNGRNGFAKSYAARPR